MEADLVVTNDIVVSRLVGRSSRRSSKIYKRYIDTVVDLLEDLVAAESSNVSKKRSVLPPRIERHSEDIVLRMRMMFFKKKIFF